MLQSVPLQILLRELWVVSRQLRNKYFRLRVVAGMVGLAVGFPFDTGKQPGYCSRA